MGVTANVYIIVITRQLLSQCFRNSNSFNFTATLWVGITIIPPSRWGNWVSKRLNVLLKIIQLLRVRARAWILAEESVAFYRFSLLPFSRIKIVVRIKWEKHQEVWAVIVNDNRAGIALVTTIQPTRSAASFSEDKLHRSQIIIRKLLWKLQK